MAFILTTRNRLVDPLNMSVEDVHRQDIALALAKICRWGGMCNPFYSVAEHSVRVAGRAAQMALAEERNPDEVMLVRQYALLHDAAEAYLGDLRLPLKRLPEFAFYREVEDKLLATIHLSAGLDPRCPAWVRKMVHDADAAERESEMQVLMVKRDDGLTLDWKAAEDLFTAHLRLCFDRWARL